MNSPPVPPTALLHAFDLNQDTFAIARAQAESFVHAEEGPHRLGARVHHLAGISGSLREKALELRKEAASALQAAAGFADPSLPESKAATMRQDAVSQGTLPGIIADDLEFRALFPGLDRGIYACSHSMGIPSLVSLGALVSHLHGLLLRGIAVWEDGEWLEVMERYGKAVVELCGGDPARASGVWFPNVSDGLGCFLDALPPTQGRDEIVFTEGHFTTGHYANHQWAQKHGGRAVVVPWDERGFVPADRVIAAITPRTRVLSLSHALFQSGWLQDVDAIFSAAFAGNPDLVVLLDAYQTAGTVPLHHARWGERVVVLGGGHKQLRASAGAGYAVVPHTLLPELRMNRAGWWGHRDTWGFHKGPIQRDEGSPGKLLTGTPSVAPMVHLLAELDVLRLLGEGSLQRGVNAVRARSVAMTSRLLLLAESNGLTLRSPREDERRAGFICLHFSSGKNVAHRLAEEGVAVDFRPDSETHPQVRRDGEGRVSSGILRLSPGIATFPYELSYTLMRAVALEEEGK